MTENAAVLPDRPEPKGRYPHYRRAGDFIFVSGTTSRRPDNTYVGAIENKSGQVELDIKEQTRATIESIGSILNAAEATLEDVVQISTVLIDMKDFEGYNEVYGEFFDESGPARTTVGINQLHHPHLLIEITATAYKPQPN